MPHPITSVRQPPYTLDFGRDAGKKVPELASLALNIIGAASMADADFLRLVAPFTHGRSAPVIEFFLSLRNEGPKVAVIEALAAASLSKERFDLFKAVAKQYSTAVKHRQPIAHWLWGHCIEIPDALLLLNPKDWLEERALADPIYVKAYRAYQNGDADALKSCATELYELSASRFDCVQVYRKKDFQTAEKILWQASKSLKDFHIILGWDLSDRAQGDELAKKLAAELET